MLNRLLAISGPSAVGKGTIVRRILAKYPDIMELSVSATTRQIRDKETHGLEYYFHTCEEFEDQIRNGHLLEWVTFDGNYYGTQKQALNDIFSRNKVTNYMTIDTRDRDRDTRCSIS